MNNYHIFGLACIEFVSEANIITNKLFIKLFDDLLPDYWSFNIRKVWHSNKLGIYISIIQQATVH
jgi:hypothetical protein